MSIFSSWRLFNRLVLLSQLSKRHYAPAPRLREDEEPLDEESELPEEVSEDGEVVKKSNLIPFDTLRGYVSYDTLKALTFKPFTLSAMSEVQRRVLKLMPYLSGGKLASVSRQSEEDGELVDNPNAIEDEDGMKRGREDLLVKAKTGTGKTIVSLHLPLNL